MRLTFDYVTFSVIGLSAVFLSPILLQFSQAAIGSQTIYPVRLTLPGLSLAGVVTGPGSSDLIDPAQGSAVNADPDMAEIAPPSAAISAKPTRGGAFATSFGSYGPAASPARDPRSFGNVLAVHYDLGAHAGSAEGMSVQSPDALAGTIDVRKRIRVGKAAPTRIDVKVGSGANIYVNAAQLSSILETQGKVLKASSSAALDGFVSLDDLRSYGFKVRYDAVGDALVVDGDV